MSLYKEKTTEIVYYTITKIVKALRHLHTGIDGSIGLLMASRLLRSILKSRLAMASAFFTVR